MLVSRPLLNLDVQSSRRLTLPVSYSFNLFISIDLDNTCGGKKHLFGFLTADLFSNMSSASIVPNLGYDYDSSL
jgi:hypothetical protein